MNAVMIAEASATRRTIDATHLCSLIDAFLADKKRRCSHRTYENYLNDLQPFLKWWNECGHTFHHELSETVFNGFIRHLETDYRNAFGRQATTYTKWRVTKRVRQILIYAHHRGFVPVSIFELCPLYKDCERLKFYPTAQELYHVILAAEGETRLRDAALIAFAISTGARRFELANARMEHLVFDTPTTNVRVGDIHTGYIRLLKVKGDAEGKGIGRVSVFDSVAGLLLKIYLRSVNRTEGTVFGVTDTQMFNIVERLGKRAGIDEIHPHAFRSALVDYWSDYHHKSGHMADLALKMQVGHTVPKDDPIYRYIDTRNEAKTLRRIREFHTSPLLSMPWNWAEWPVHVEA